MCGSQALFPLGMLHIRGDPIVGSPANAWNTFLKSGIDSLVLGHHFVEK
jgi:predicted NodU family carbamoyl transferase